MRYKQKTKPKRDLNQRVLYFSYGSNLDVARLTSRVGHVVNLGTYSLRGYRLTFDTGTKVTSYANIIADNNSIVEGVIYEMTYKQLLKLDMFEGLYQRFYRELINCPIEQLNGRKLHFYISPVRRVEFARPITREYYNAIHNGAVVNNLTAIVNYMEGYAIVEEIDEYQEFARQADIWDSLKKRFNWD